MLPVEDPKVSSNEGSAPTHVPRVFIFAVWAVVLLVAAWNNDDVRGWVLRFRDEWPLLSAILGTVIVVIPLAILLWMTARTKGRLALIIYGVIPVLVALIFGVTFLKDTGQRILAVRSVFVVVACLLPPTMFYLFVFSRKDSLLNEFVANLDRLGLLRLSDKGTTEETDDARLRRLYSYLLRFQAVYGPLRKNQVDSILGKPDPNTATPDRPWDRESFSDTDSVIAWETTVPVIFATMLVALGWLTSLPLRDDTKDTNLMLMPAQNPVSFAFLGAYVFSIQMLFWRYVRKDLRPNAYMALSLRVILAVLSTWAVTVALQISKIQTSTNLLVLFGFIIGFFPRIAWQIIGQLAQKVAGLVLPSLETPLPITDLAGLTVWHEARLQEEDIENIPNMATADLAELMLNTRFPPDRIVDWVDEAILQTHLGPPVIRDGAAMPRALLAAHGIRTASGLIEASRRPADRAAFEKLLPSSPDGLSPIHTLATALRTNPSLDLIQRWRGLGKITEIELAQSAGSVR